MLLIGYSWVDVLMWMLYISLILVIVVISYKMLLARMARGHVKKEDYCELENLDQEPASGELVFYFTSSMVRKVQLILLDNEMNDFKVVYNKECQIGGNIVRFDSTVIPNGMYYYSLRTENQKVMKKMTILN